MQASQPPEEKKIQKKVSRSFHSLLRFQILGHSFTHSGVHVAGFGSVFKEYIPWHILGNRRQDL